FQCERQPPYSPSADEHIRFHGLQLLDFPYPEKELLKTEQPANNKKRPSRGLFFTICPYSAPYEAANSAPTLALCLTSSILATKLCPSVNSFTLPSRNGVTSLPLMPFAFASAMACSMMPSIKSLSSACS